MDGSLFACGYFDMAGQTPAHSIARWGTDSILDVHVLPSHPLDFSMYPNPVADDFHIEIQSQKMQQFQFVVFDMMGKEVASGNMISDAKKNISVKNLADGVYFIKVFNGESFIVRKFVKQ